MNKKQQSETKNSTKTSSTRSVKSRARSASPARRAPTKTTEPATRSKQDYMPVIKHAFVGFVVVGLCVAGVLIGQSDEGVIDVQAVRAEQSAAASRDTQEVLPVPEEPLPDASDVATSTATTTPVDAEDQATSTASGVVSDEENENVIDLEDAEDQRESATTTDEASVETDTIEPDSQD